MIEAVTLRFLDYVIHFHHEGSKLRIVKGKYNYFTDFLSKGSSFLKNDKEGEWVKKATTAVLQSIKSPE